MREEECERGEESELAVSIGTSVNVARTLFSAAFSSKAQNPLIFIDGAGARAIAHRLAVIIPRERREGDEIGTARARTRFIGGK